MTISNLGIKARPLAFVGSAHTYDASQSFVPRLQPSPNYSFFSALCCCVLAHKARGLSSIPRLHISFSILAKRKNNQRNVCVLHSKKVFDCSRLSNRVQQLQNDAVSMAT